MKHTWMILAICIQFATSAGAADDDFTPRASASSCTTVDLAPAHPEAARMVRNQDGMGWCYAYAAADMASFVLDQPVSALDLSLTYVLAGPDSEQYQRSRTVLAERNNGGFTGKALELTLEKKGGFCLEDDLPTNQNFDSITRALFDSLKKNLESAMAAKAKARPGDMKAQLAVIAADDAYKNAVEVSGHWDRLRDRIRSTEELNQKARAGDPTVSCGTDVETWLLSGGFPSVELADVLDALKQERDAAAVLTRLRDRACDGHRVSPVDWKIEDEYVQEQRNRGHRLFAKLDENLDSGRAATLLYISTDILKQDLPFALPRHAGAVIGRRFNAKSGSCEYHLRNSYGKGCDWYLPPYDKNCDPEDGSTWVDEAMLSRRVFGITTIEGGPVAKVARINPRSAPVAPAQETAEARLNRLMNEARDAKKPAKQKESLLALESEADPRALRTLLEAARNAKGNQSIVSVIDGIIQRRAIGDEDRALLVEAWRQGAEPKTLVESRLEKELGALSKEVLAELGKRKNSAISRKAVEELSKRAPKPEVVAKVEVIAKPDPVPAPSPVPVPATEVSSVNLKACLNITDHEVSSKCMLDGIARGGGDQMKLLARACSKTSSSFYRRVCLTGGVTYLEQGTIGGLSDLMKYSCLQMQDHESASACSSALLADDPSPLVQAMRSGCEEAYASWPSRQCFTGGAEFLSSGKPLAVHSMILNSCMNMTDNDGAWNCGLSVIGSAGDEDLKAAANECQAKSSNYAKRVCLTERLANPRPVEVPRMSDYDASVECQRLVLNRNFLLDGRYSREVCANYNAEGVEALKIIVSESKYLNLVFNFPETIKDLTSLRSSWSRECIRKVARAGFDSTAPNWPARCSKVDSAEDLENFCEKTGLSCR